MVMIVSWFKFCSHTKRSDSGLNNDNSRVPYISKSISMDATTIHHPAIRPKTLSSSLSESAIGGIPGPTVVRRSGGHHTPTTPVSSVLEEENSSPESTSTDSTSISDDKLKKRKKKGKLFRKILGKEGEKPKVT